MNMKFFQLLNQTFLTQSFVYTHDSFISGMDVVDVLQIIHQKWNKCQETETEWKRK